MQQITDEIISKVHLVTSLQDRVLTWYIKYCADHPLAMLADTKDALNKEFINHKSNLHSIIGFKEITMRSNKTPWELDQKLKCVICEDSMQLTDGQHCKWFIASLIPHLRIAFS